MRKTDMILPHRQMIHGSLRKEAEKLRRHIDEYRVKYKTQYQKNVEELEEAKNQLDLEYEQVKTSIMETLSSDAEAMKEISNIVVCYGSAYYNRRLAYKKRDINQIQMEIVNEYITFLSDQMRSIGLEIELLSKRRELLSREADVTDIIQLIRLSGQILPADCISDAKNLIDRITVQMEADYEEDRIKWYTLLNLRTILEERVSFVSEIQYIAWLIEQKRQLSKELKTYRNTEYKVQNKLQAEAESIEDEIKYYNSILVDNARVIRFYWARPMVFISAEIEEKKEKLRKLKGSIANYSHSKRSLFDEREGIISDIRDMKEQHSDDSIRWDRLQRERRSITDEIEDYKSRIDDANSEIEHINSDIVLLRRRLNGWNTKRKDILGLFKKYSVPLIRISSTNQFDEAVFAEIRLKELMIIEEDGIKAAQQTYQREFDKLISEKEAVCAERDVAVSEFEKRVEEARQVLDIATDRLNSEMQAVLSAAKEKAAEIERRVVAQKKALEAAKKRLAKARSSDTRIIVIRLFSDTAEETKIKQEIAIEQKRLNGAEAELNTAKKLISTGSWSDIPAIVVVQKEVDNAQKTVDHILEELESTRKTYESRIADYERQIQELKPRPDRPTPEERAEIKKIQLWKKTQSQRGKKERRNADDGTN